MTIEEVRELKREAEQKIAAIVLDLNRKTELPVEDVRYRPEYTCNGTCVPFISLVIRFPS